MRVCFYTNNLSPHQLPLASVVVNLVGRDNFLYVVEEIKWRGKIIATDLPVEVVGSIRAKEWLENADVLYTGGLRPIDLLEQRAMRGLKTLYYSERWFKPFHHLPGKLRMLVPKYRKMAESFVRVANESQEVWFLPTGPWAKRDFLSLGVRSEKLIDWGYFVSPSAGERRRLRKNGDPLKILWVGRDLWWKRVGDIEKAVALVARKESVVFTKLMKGSLAEVRDAMRQHDLYVLASDENEGWGAALNEALEEGMNALGTFEAGSSAAMLPRERLYHAGDWKALARLIERELRGELPPCSIGDWTAASAAERLILS